VAHFSSYEPVPGISPHPSLLVLETSPRFGDLGSWLGCTASKVRPLLPATCEQLLIPCAPRSEKPRLRLPHSLQTHRHTATRLGGLCGAPPPCAAPPLSNPMTATVSRPTGHPAVMAGRHPWRPAFCVQQRTSFHRLLPPQQPLPQFQPNSAQFGSLRHDPAPASSFRCFTPGVSGGRRGPGSAGQPQRGDQEDFRCLPQGPCPCEAVCRPAPPHHRGTTP
jgi:hypothetical protein